MKPGNLSNVIRTMLRAKARGLHVTPLLESGPPGIGKTALAAQAAEAEGAVFFPVDAALRGPMDVLGMPIVDDAPQTKYKRPDILPPLVDGPVLWFIDELDKAPPLTQNALLGGIHTGIINGHRVPGGAVCVAAMNNATDRAHSHRMSTALLSRFRQVGVECDLDDWSQYMLNHNRRTEVVAFVRWRSDLLHQFNPQAEDTAFPCPRTWENVSHILEEGHSPVDEQEQIFGTVGKGPGAEFVAFLRVWQQCPSVESIVMNPDTAPVPENDPGAMYAIAGNLARRAKADTFDAIVRYVKRMPQDFGVFTVAAIVRRVPAVQQTRSFVEWSTANAAVLF